ncbi:HNH endonuclease [Kaistia sp. MMO-174]|uniref:HNH endonuclease n=1 Tax=Kaistia sp. MMO-174 TaxID=3081256 RepID=UPI003018F621
MIRIPKPILGRPPGDERARDRERRGSQPWRGWYNTAPWRRLRMDVFTRDLFTCQMPGCGRIEGDTSKLACDHITPHRGDPRLFWDPSNLQTLCKPCHDRDKQRLEATADRAWS